MGLLFTRQRKTRRSSTKGLIGAEIPSDDGFGRLETQTRRSRPFRRMIDAHPTFVHRLSWTVMLLWFLISARPSYLYYSNRVHALVVEDQLAETAVPDLPVFAFARPSIHDDTDGFAAFTKTDNCSFNSLELHTPFEPLCKRPAQLLEEMSSGGRHGFDAPYSLRNCDMRWYKPDEICTILSRFRGVNLVGDSLMRNLAVAFHVLMRRDFYNGGRSSWVDDPDGYDCHCRQPFQEKGCIFHAAVSTSVVHERDPNSLHCSYEGHAKVEYLAVTAYPIMDVQFETLLNKIYDADDEWTKPTAFVYGHGLWNDLEAHLTFLWWEQLDEVMRAEASHLFAEGTRVPRLFITPSAGSPKKPEIFWAKQGNLAIARFEKEVGAWMRDRGVDHLGIFNLTVQSTSPDGTHAGMQVNLVKAMMVLNWLDHWGKEDIDDKSEL